MHDADTRWRPGAPAVTRALLGLAVLCSFFWISVMQIATGLAFVNWALGLRRGLGRPVRAPLWAPAVAFLASSLVSGVIAGTLPAVKTALSDGLPLLVYLVAANALAEPRAMLGAVRLVVVGGASAAAYGLAPALLESSGLRIQGSLSHYYTFSGVEALAAVAAVAWLVHASTPRERLVALTCTLVMSVALLYTQTRAAWLAVLAGAALVVLVRKPRIAWLLPVAAVAAYFLAPDATQQRVRTLADSQDATVHERLEMWRTGARMWRDAPWFGIGGRMVGARFAEYRDPASPYPDTPGHLHNNAVNLLAERGALGLAAWLAFWILWFAASVRALRATGERGPPELRLAVAASLGALAAFHVIGMFEFDAGDSEVATLALFVAAWPFAARAALGNETSRQTP
ncbi:MAG: O-antigen ligase family protein [Planctomycetes bacterium]|nr:O-antigen ligase family protein [Planctomycetota bacterium]